jgi:hypothetical protein
MCPGIVAAFPNICCAKVTAWFLGSSSAMMMVLGKQPVHGRKLFIGHGSSLGLDAGIIQHRRGLFLRKKQGPGSLRDPRPPGYIRPDDTPKISRLFRWTRIIQRHAINLACQSAEPSAYDEAVRVRNFYRREIVKHSRSVLAAIDRYRSQIHPQLDYVAPSSSRTNE